MTQRRSKYNAKPTVIDGIRFDSKAEARRYEELKLMEKAGEIINLEVHRRFLLQKAFTDEKGKRHRAIHYEVDFSYHDCRDSLRRLVVEDVKGKKTAVFRIKEKLFRFKYPMIDLRILEV